MNRHARHMLNSLSRYIEKHPQQRFWQALRNWSEFPFIYMSKVPVDHPDLVDTFHVSNDLKREEGKEDPMVDRDCALLDGKCDCPKGYNRRVPECKKYPKGRFG